jgi:ribosomal protein L35
MSAGRKRKLRAPQTVSSANIKAVKKMLGV